MRRQVQALALVFAALPIALLAEHPPMVLDQTQRLVIERPLDEIMVEGIGRFADRALQQADANRGKAWRWDYTSAEAYERSLLPWRSKLSELLGVVDQRVKATGLELLATTAQSAIVAKTRHCQITAVRWGAIDGVHAEGLFLQPLGDVKRRVVLLPDAEWTPEMLAGLEEFVSPIGADLASRGCEVLVPCLVNRRSNFSRNDEIGRATNLTHREFIYRQAFEVGRHIIGYEVQKVLSAIDQLELRNQSSRVPIEVFGIGEGGLLALHSAAIDPRIEKTTVIGYFQNRSQVWREPIYRNVWGQLTSFSDAEVASMIAPRTLVIQAQGAPETRGPKELTGRDVAAPGTIVDPAIESVLQEFDRAKVHWEKLGAVDRIRLITDPQESLLRVEDPSRFWAVDRRTGFNSQVRQERQVRELSDHCQAILRKSFRLRDKRWQAVDRSSLQAYTSSAADLRDMVHDKLIGRLPTPSMKPNPRSRRILVDRDYVGYEVMLDVYPDVIAGGVLLLPTGLAPGEKRPVVVCQHGLEGTPMDTISGVGSKGYRAYKSFSVELVKRGFIVYAPQNPYRGFHRFRELQRKSNPLGRSLFSYIIPQHLVTLRWLASLPHVDSNRIGFYGLSYGGKTAVRVPPMLPPNGDQPGYCLSVCSADFNEWVSKNASVDAKFSYIWTGEYEIFEWNMAHVANYAELAQLMIPRPFMVERGHDDGVGLDEWVAWEYAKVRRQYSKLGIGDRTEIEFFDGPHTINGQGTFEFLHRHLNWSVP